MTERMAQIQMARLRASRLRAEAITCTDTTRLDAIAAEMQLIYDGLCDVREQQIIESLPKPKPPRRRWWRRG
jgi:hypothetical protein